MQIRWAAPDRKAAWIGWFARWPASGSHHPSGRCSRSPPSWRQYASAPRGGTRWHCSSDRQLLAKAERLKSDETVALSGAEVAPKRIARLRRCMNQGK